MTPVIERRASTRQMTVNNEASVQHMEWMGRRSARTRLIDISDEGALILMEEQPALYRRLWVRLEKPFKTDWILAFPVRFGQRQEVGIRFCHPCPRVLLWGATHG